MFDRIRNTPLSLYHRIDTLCNSLLFLHLFYFFFLIFAGGGGFRGGGGRGGFGNRQSQDYGPPEEVSVSLKN